MKRLSLLLVSLLILLASPAVSAVPLEMTAHGTVAVSGSPFTGPGEFKFALVATAENGAETIVWTHDGTGSDGTEPETSIQIDVANGYYQVILGDTEVKNMSPLDAAPFDTEELKLRLWFSDGTNGFQQLSPDQSFTSVAYAIRARQVVSGSIDTSALADASVTSIKLAPESVLSEAIAAGSITEVEIAADTVSSAHIVDGTIASEDIADGAITAAKLAGDIVLGGEVGELPDSPTFAGTVTAQAFVGDGSALSNLPGLTEAERSNGVTSTRLGALNIEAQVGGTGQDTPENHVVIIRNQHRLRGADGLAIILENTARDPERSVQSLNKYITFYDGPDEIVGRIEGQSTQDLELVFGLLAGLQARLSTSFEIYDFSFGVEENEDWFNPGGSPSLTFEGGVLPMLELEGGVLPSATFDDGAFPPLTFNRGDFPEFGFAPGRLPSLSFNRGSLPAFEFTPGTLPSANFSEGEEPSLTFSGGSLPSIDFFRGTFSPGSLPTATLDPGALPSLQFNRGTLPDFSVKEGTLPTANLTPGTLPVLSLERAGQLPSLSVGNGSLPSLTFQPGQFPTPNFEPGQFPTPSFEPGTLPSINSLPFEITEFGVSVRAEFVAELVAEFGADLSLLKAAWQLLADPVCRAIEESRLAFSSVGVTYESGAGDYAEWLERLDHDEALEAGDIVGVHGGLISKKTEGADQILVVSFRPLVLGNTPEGDEELYEKVAFMGQVPVRVLGAVNRGDYILPSGNGDGLARAVPPESIAIADLDQVIGVAWGESSLEFEKYVKVAVGLRPNRLAEAVQAESARMTELASEVTSLRQRVSAMEAENASLKAQIQRVASLEQRLEQALAKIEGTETKDSVDGSTLTRLR